MKKTILPHSTAPELIDLYPEKIFDCSETVFQFFRSPESFAAHVAAMDTEKVWHKETWSEAPSRASFTGTKDMKEAINLAFEGWPEGVKRVAELREKILFARPQAPRYVKHDVAGAFPNVPRMLAGNPLHMRRIEIADSRRAPVITLMVDMSVNCDCPAENLTRRAATVAALCDLIEDEGYRAHIVSCARTSNGDKSAVVAVTCKEPYDHADVGRLAFGVGHSAFYRRLMFAAWGGSNECKFLGQSLGYARAVKADEKMNSQRVYSLEEPSAYYFQSDTYAIGDGVAGMIAHLQKQGCPCFPKKEAA